MTIVTSIYSGSALNTPGPSRWILGAAVGFVQITASGNPDIATVRLEGSVDGVNWNLIETLSGEIIPVVGDVGTIMQVNMAGYSYIHAYLTDLQGGTSPVINVLLVSGGSSTFLAPLFAGQASPSPSAAHWVFGGDGGSLQITCTGSPTTALVAVEGSLDSVNWTELASLNCAPTTNIIEFNLKRMAFVRGNLKTLSGGTSPTVTGSIAIL